MNKRSFFYILRASKLARMLALFFAISVVNSVVAPSVAWALTAGPSQPEVQSFEPVGTNQMVDLFTGDFTYNIPLFDLPGVKGGYPFNIAYHSGIQMDQESSWVGLGWTLNPGAINRTVRGFPDDFNGETVEKTMSIKDNITVGTNTGFDFELGGAAASKATYAISMKMNTRIYYNNYRGFGVSFGTGSSFSKGKMTAGVGLNFDSQSGSSISTNVALDKSVSDKEVCYGVGLALSSRRGLMLTTSRSVRTSRNGYGNKHNLDQKVVDSYSGSATLSYAEPSFSPIMPYETKGIDVQALFTAGFGICGAYGNMSFGGFFNVQKIKDKNQNIPCYGYMNLHTPFDNGDNVKSKYLLDFAREKDGVVTDESSNLAIPYLTHDYYMIQGQGIGGMFRPFRSDFGHVHDPNSESVAHGVMIGVDIGGGHWGINGSYSNTRNVVGDWVSGGEDGNVGNALTAYRFTNKFICSKSDEDIESYPDYEPAYFKVHGDYAPIDKSEFDFIGGDKPIPVDVSASGTTKTSVLYGSSQKTNRYDAGFKKRVARSQVVTPLSNKYLRSSSGEFSIQYFPNGSNSLENLSRLGNDNIIGAYTTIGVDGRRYVYALPAMNKTQEEYVFSVPGNRNNVDNTLITGISACMTGSSHPKGTDQFYSKTKIPEYAYSYMLTSVLGADYVDKTNNGPSDDDAGYWVKFNYKKASNDYKWRAPYCDANLDPGLRSYTNDDKGSVLTGTKEIWYVASVETGSHIAIFNTSARNDGKDAGNGQKMHKLDRIDIYTRSEYENNALEDRVPIKSVHFVYSTSKERDLCKGVPNADDDRGKLTLESLSFSYGDNDRKLGAYTFDYGQVGGETQNPGYNYDRYDRWGAYKNTLVLRSDGTIGEEYNKEKQRNLPYVQQCVEGLDVSNFLANIIDGLPDAFYMQQKRFATSWNLTDIGLPSGGSIHIDYERDDYAYVQHRKATQMFAITPDPSSTNGGKIPIDISGKEEANTKDFKVYFQLDQPIPVSLFGGDENGADEYFKEKYLAPLRRKVNGEYIYQLYFKILSDLNSVRQEFVSGYAPLIMDDGSYGFAGEKSDKLGEKLYYTHGFVTLKAVEKKLKVRTRYYHPFAAAAWQFIKLNKPEILSELPKLSEKDLSADSDEGKADVITAFAQMLGSVQELFSDYVDLASKKKLANKIEPGLSIIKLGTPDGRKYGGDCRVSKITLSDNWGDMTNNRESEHLYGQVYEYTKEENGQTISSGVAAYEPMIGGDENPLRWAKPYPQSVTFSSDYNMFFEYPVNESLFPGPSVGYSQVTVRSINSKEKYDAEKSGNGDSYKYEATGYSVHKFNTYQEYPVVVQETEIVNRPDYFPYYLPFVGLIEKNHLTVGQGYSIVLNDMHGKPKSVEHFAYVPYGSEQERTSALFYSYFDKYQYYDGSNVRTTENNLPVLVSDMKDNIEAEDFAPMATIGEGVTQGQKTFDSNIAHDKLLGVEYDVFSDMRFARTRAIQGGVNFNLELFLYLTIPAPWPNVFNSTSNFKSAVTNKVIHKSGILKSVTVVEGSSSITTENLVFDDHTGRPLLTTTQNNFGNPVYTYAMPAYKEYPGMGSAYENIGIEMALPALAFNSSETTVSKNSFSPKSSFDYLSVGDELASGNRLLSVYEKNANSIQFHLDNGETNSKATYVIRRSGRRNMLSADAAGIVALDNPLENRIVTKTRHAIKRDEDDYENSIIKKLLDELSSVMYSGIRGKFGEEWSVSYYGGDYYKDNPGSTNKTNVSNMDEYPLLRKYAYCFSLKIEDKTDDPAVAIDDVTGPYKNSYRLLDGVWVHDVFVMKIQFNDAFYEDFEGVTKSNVPYLPYRDESSLDVRFPAGFRLSEPTMVKELNELDQEVTSNKYFTTKYYEVREQYKEYLSTSWSSWYKIFLFPSYIDFANQKMATPFLGTYLEDLDAFPAYPYSSSVLEYPISVPQALRDARLSSSKDFFNDTYEMSASNVLQASVSGYCQVNDRVWNPVWAPSLSYYYNDGRTSDGDVRYDGVFQNGDENDKVFYPFIWGRSNEWLRSEKWVCSASITKYDSKGRAVEERDALGRYSMVRYQGNNPNPQIVAKNARYDAVFFEDFETFGDRSISDNGTQITNFDPSWIQKTSHTGKYGLWANGAYNYQVELRGNTQLPPGKYVVTFWGHQEFNTPTITVPVVRVATAPDVFKDVSGHVTMHYDKYMYCVESTITVSETVLATVQLERGTELDDILIYPVGADVSVNVYDQSTLRPCAQIDQHNVATYYYYGFDGSLHQVKKETPNGVQTVQVNRMHRYTDPQ